MDDLDALATAMELLRRGRFPVAVHPPGIKIKTKNGEKVSKGKEPIVPAWGEERPTEDELLHVYAAHPGAGVGVVLGPRGGLIDIEVDGPEGQDSLARLMGGEAPPTLGWSSRRGPHAVYLWDDRLAGLDPQKRAKFTLPEYPGVEFRFGSDGQAQSACPPTVGEDGVPRRWNDVDEVAALPESAIENLRRALNPPKTQAAPGNASGRLVAEASDPIAAWFRKALAGESGKAAIAPEGERHDTLLRAAKTLGGHLHHGYIKEDEVVASLAEGGRRAGLPEAEVAETIRDGLEYGKRTPLPWPDKLAQPHPTRAQNGVAPFGPDDDAVQLPLMGWPGPPGEEAYHGPLGRAVRLIEPHTEADPLGILAQALVAFGSMVGRGPHLLVDGARHGLNEFLVLVGESAVARKGTSKARALALLDGVDVDWQNGRVRSGLSSGEGLITPVRDPVWTEQPIKEKGRMIGSDRVCTDEGESDKRLLVIETEFGSVLRALQREGNRLSALLRAAWDGEHLATMTKSPLRASEPHISIVGHITFGELRALLSIVDVVGGLANRVVWLCVRRARCLPFGGRHESLAEVQRGMGEALDFARAVGPMSFSPAASRVYADNYARLSTPPPGVLGVVTSRAPAHVIRWAMLYALADRSGVVAEEHLLAALALIDAANRAAAHIFGDSLGHPDAEKILAALRALPEGLTRTGISESVFNRHATKDRINKALSFLMEHGLVREMQDEPRGGRPAFRYCARERGESSEASPSPYDVPSLPSPPSQPQPANNSPEREVFDV